MDKYIEREATYTIAKKICDAIRNGEYHSAVFAYDIMDWIDDVPAADVVPVRHGQLIDADALLNLLNHCMFPSDMVTTTAVSMATNWIQNAPTIIPASTVDKEGEG